MKDVNDSNDGTADVSTEPHNSGDDPDASYGCLGPRGAKNAFRKQQYKNSLDSKYNLMEGNLKDIGKELSLLSAEEYPEVSEFFNSIHWSSLDEAVDTISAAEEMLPFSNESNESEENRSKPWTSLNEAITVMSEEEIPAYANEEGEWWEEWIKKFQEFMDKHSLDNTKKLEWLSCRLIRSAKTVFDEMHAEDKADYDCAITCLGKKLYEKRYVSARRDPQKGLYKYAMNLLLLVQRIHPEMSAKDQEQVVLARIASEASRPYVLEHWTCLNEAVDVILANEEVPVYCDQDDWNQWKVKFQYAATEHGLNNTRKILWLSCLLSGEAKKVFDALPEEDKKDYDFTIDKLEKNLYISRFMNRNKKYYETWETLQIELYSLAKDCYPSTNSSDLDKIVLKQLCSIIRQYITLSEEPTSLDDAILTVSAYEAVPTPYTEDGNWEKWIHTFEKSLHTKKITDNDIKLRYLQLRLTGKASTLFSGIVEIQNDFDKVKKLLGVEIYRNKFEKRQRQFGQTWRKYTDELRNLGEKIYPPDQLGKCVLDKILSDPSAAEMKYSGDVCEWDKWIAKFDQIVHSCSLDDDARLKWFDASLIGRAGTLFDCEIPKECVTSYIEAKGAMEKHMNTIFFVLGLEQKMKVYNPSFYVCKIMLERHSQLIEPRR
eukprot:Em0006g665a